MKKYIVINADDFGLSGGTNEAKIPAEVVEIRKPRINLFKRVPNVIKNLTKLVWVIRVQNK